MVGEAGMKQPCLINCLHESAGKSDALIHKGYFRQRPHHAIAVLKHKKTPPSREAERGQVWEEAPKKADRHCPACQRDHISP